MRTLLPSMLMAAVVAVPVAASAHTGSALDADGCHADHRNDTYHCHRGAAAGYTFPNRAAMQEAVRTGNFPEKTVDEEGFFSRLWPWGNKHEQAEETPSGESGEAATAAPGDSPAAGAAAPAVSPEQRELEQKLTVLRGWYEMGLITKEEYEAKRKAVLDEL